MSALLSVVCVVLSVTTLHADVNTLTTVINRNTDNKSPMITNKNFVDVIKESLRRNNDDYAAGDHLDLRQPAPVDTRRALNDSEHVPAESIPDPNTKIQPATPTVDTTLFRSIVKELKEPLRKKKHERLTHNVHKVRSKIKLPNNNTERKTADKWKGLIEKSNKVRKYTSSWKIGPSSSVRVSRVHVLRTPSEVTAGETTFNTTYSIKPVQVFHIGMISLPPPELVRNPPNADQLDMAPARGAYIHDMRLKGRFCYRHVLWPEGPKYNSKGETIMPAFNGSMFDNKKKKFFHTIKPNYVLPRCCNCCKKSVLGCQ